MDLEGVILSEISQAEKENTVYMEYKKKTSKKNKNILIKVGHGISEGD